jgi:hypothetical protein
MYLPKQPAGIPKFVPKPIQSGQPAIPKTKIATLFDSNAFSQLKQKIGKVSPQREAAEKYKTKDSDLQSMEASAEYCQNAERDRGAINGALKKFSESLGEIHRAHGTSGESDDIRYADKLQQHVDAVLKYPGTVSHDLDIVFRESLRFLSTKAIRHGDDPRQKEVGKKIIEKLYENFPDYINTSHSYREIFPKTGKSNRDLAEIAYEKISQRLNSEPSPSSGPTTTGRFYKQAAKQLIKGEKPKYTADGQYVAYIPAQGRRDMHAHIHQNYDPTKLYPYGFPWAANIGQQTGVVGSSVMPIPHHIVMKEPPSGAPADYSYYTDNNVAKTMFASFDQSMIKAFNNLSYEHQQALIPSATGIEMMVNDEALKRLGAAAEAFSHNVVAAKLEAGKKDVLVLFGELTTNKPQVPQEMIGSTPGTFVDNSAKLQLALFSAAEKGAMRALEKLSPEKQEEIKVQIRLVIHTDTEKEGVKLGVSKLGDTNEALRDIAQPTVDDLEKVCNQIEAGLQPPAHKGIRRVVQLAHFAGVNTVNWADRDAERTAKVDHLVDTTRGYKKLEVLMDTSWLTASARYINTGMGDFLQHSNDPAIQEIGDRFMRADKIANDGFMFFSAGERHFQERLTAGDNSPEVIDGLALMRESCDRCTETYFRELGGIYADLQNKPELLGNIRNYIEADIKNGPSEGNYIGMLLKQHGSESGIQARTPFVWGADGLTQFAEPSGANKFFMYANQLGPVETLMEQLRSDSTGKPVYHDILRSMKMGDEREQGYWSNAEREANISTDGMQKDGTLDPNLVADPQAHDNVAANHVIPSRHAVRMQLNNDYSVLRAKL